MHADVSSTFWSPITWLFSITTGYSIYTIHLEFVFYCIAAATGMYRLSKHLVQQNKTAFITAISYAGSGIFIGHAQHTNWVSSMAILPWLFFYFIIIIHNPTFRNAVKLSLIASLFIVTAHSNFIISSFYLFGILSIILALRNKENRKKITYVLSATLLLIISLTAGYIYSVVELMPFIFRGTPLSFAETTSPFSLQSMISFLFPFSTVTVSESFLTTDVTTRNGYMGLVILASCMIMVIHSKNFYQKLFFSVGLVFFFLSTGSFLTRFFIENIPLGGYIRITGFFRLYALFFFFLAAGFVTRNILNRAIPVIKIKSVLIVLILITIVTLFYSGKSALTQTSLLTSTLFPADAADLKKWLTSISSETALFTQSVIQLFFLAFFYYFILKKKETALIILCCIDIFISANMNMPYTVVGQKSVKEIQSVLNQSPDGFPEPTLKPVKENRQPDYATDKLIGNWSMYGKEQGTTKQQLTYPIFFADNYNYFQTGLNDVTQKTPFVLFADKIEYYKDSIRFSNNDSATCFLKKEVPSQTSLHIITNKNSGRQIEVRHVTPNSYNMITQSTDDEMLILKQNFYLNWTAKIDGVNTAIYPCNYTFMAIKIPAGKHKIEFSYLPKTAKFLGLINILFLILAISYLLITGVKRKKIA